MQLLFHFLNPTFFILDHKNQTFLHFHWYNYHVAAAVSLVLMMRLHSDAYQEQIRQERDHRLTIQRELHEVKSESVAHSHFLFIYFFLILF